MVCLVGSPLSQPTNVGGLVNLLKRLIKVSKFQHGAVHDPGFTLVNPSHFAGNGTQARVPSVPPHIGYPPPWVGCNLVRKELAHIDSIA